MSGKFFIIGSTGNVGSQVVEQLLKENKPVVGATRNGKASYPIPGCEYRKFDFTDSTTWASCLDNVDYVFLMRPVHIFNIKRDMEPFIRELKKRRVNHVVFMSVQGAETNERIPHRKVEQICIDLNLPCTFIRPSFFMQNLTTTHLEEIRDKKQVFTPTGKGRTNFVDVRDIGEIAGRVLMNQAHIGKSYTITGEKSYSYDEIAEHLTIGLGGDIRYINPGILRFVISNLKNGRGLMMTLIMVVLYSLVKFGKGDISTSDSEMLLGRKPVSLDEFIADHKTLLTER